jgi:hypothetical protein
MKLAKFEIVFPAIVVQIYSHSNMKHKFKWIGSRDKKRVSETKISTIHAFTSQARV